MSREDTAGDGEDAENGGHARGPDDAASENAERTPAETAQLALLLEVAGTPKPGNVDRRRDLGDLRFEHFLAGAVGAGEGLRVASEGAPVGRAFERAVDGMARQRGGNTQFGCLLLLVPLVAARVETELTPEGVTTVVENTTVEDAVDFYRAFEHVDVAVPEPGEDEEVAALDVRRGADAVPTVREREVALYDVMELSVERDGNAREWVHGFVRTFDAAESMLDDEGPAPDRVARAFLDLLGSEPDSLIETQHGERTAEHVRDRAAAIAGDLDAAEALAEDLAEEGINPGTTADIAAAATYVALERGMPV